jgi:tricorn protease
VQLSRSIYQSERTLHSQFLKRSHIMLNIKPGCFLPLGILLLIWTSNAPYVSAQPSPIATRLLRYPDIHDNRVIFTYAGDLWLSPRDGGQARRLTAHPGIEYFAKFSPDGRWIAFSADYDGNTDVYVMPSDGGEPRRLTYHPSSDLTLGWTPDSRRVLFRSTRISFTTRFARLFTVSFEGGMPDALPIPSGGLSSYSPDGTKLAYNRIANEATTWKRYRGGTQQFISIYDLTANRYEEIPHTDAADAFPMWHGDKIYFISDRDGVMNLYVYDLPGTALRQLTHYREYDVKWPSLGRGETNAIIYENGGHLYTLDLKTEKATEVQVTVASDLTLTRPRFVKVEKFINSYSLSPSGARALIGARGEIFTVPSKKGDARNLTNTSGVRELWPTWSPDGRWVAYFSDRTGEYELYIRGQDGVGEERRITNDGHAYRYGPAWSPDSTKLLFAEKTLKLFYVNVGDGKPVLIDQSSTGAINSYDWSPDSKWVAYAKQNRNLFGQIHLYSLERGKTFPVTDGMTDDRSPVFDRGGKYLYFFSNRNFSPTFSDFEPESSFVFNSSTGIYAVTLAADTPSPFAPESDEEKGAAIEASPHSSPLAGAGGMGERGKPGTGGVSAAAAKPPEQNAAEETPIKEAQPDTQKKDEAKPEPKLIKIDTENINRRVVNIPVPPGRYTGLLAAKDTLFYLSTPPAGDAGANSVLHLFDINKREDATLMTGVTSYDLSLSGDKVIYRAGTVFGIVDAKPNQKVGDGKLDLTALEMRLDPRAEWQQIFDEAWRIERDFYYDPTMRGLNWAAIKQRYAQELPYVAHRTDLNYLIGDMIGELSTSHAYVSGGEMPDVTRVGVGLLGVDFEISDGLYRFKKIYAGDNSSPSTRSPLSEPGVHVREGDYLLSVNGRPLRAGDNPFAPLENTVGKQVALKVNDKPNESGARIVTIRPVASETALRYLDWVEENRRKVSEATGGRSAYIHVPDTTVGGINAFFKAFYAQTDKDALIVDGRWNSGGFIPDFFAERLTRRILEYDAPREGENERYPRAAIYGPKVLIINEYAGSGGDSIPDYFRELGIGPIVGKRTWGGLTGIIGGLPMIDGGSVTAPSVAAWRVENGKSVWIVENKGVEPDIDLDARPDLVAAGRDPQLEQAIIMIKEQLAKNPPQNPKRPPYGPSHTKR